MSGFQNLGSQTWSRRNLNFGEIELLGVSGLVLHLLIALQTRLVLRLTGLGGAAHPVKLVLETACDLGVLGSLDLHTLGFGFQIRGVVALIRIELASVDLADPFGDIIHEVTIVGDRNDGTLVLVQKLLQP